MPSIVSKLNKLTGKDATTIEKALENFDGSGGGSGSGDFQIIKLAELHGGGSGNTFSGSGTIMNPSGTTCTVEEMIGSHKIVNVITVFEGATPTYADIIASHVYSSVRLPSGELKYYDLICDQNEASLRSATSLSLTAYVSTQPTNTPSVIVYAICI